MTGVARCHSACTARGPGVITPCSETAVTGGVAIQRHIRQHMTTRPAMSPAVPFASQADRERALSVMGSIMAADDEMCQTVLQPLSECDGI